jgi:hypothetical protein
MDAAGAGDIAGGRNDTAAAATDDDRLIRERGIVALFDCGVEGIAIEMRYRQKVEFIVINRPRVAAIAATATRIEFGFEAISAQRGHKNAAWFTI